MLVTIVQIALYILQPFLLIKNGFKLCGIDIKIKNLLYNAVLFGLVIYCIRSSPLSKFYYFPLMFLTNLILISVIHRLNIILAIVPNFFGYLIVFATEMISMVLLNAIGITIDINNASNIKGPLVWVSILLLCLITVVLDRNAIILFPLNKVILEKSNE